MIGGAGLLVVGAVAFFAFGTTKKWVGHTDLEICFLVTDANSGTPIPNALIHIRYEEPGGLCCKDVEGRNFAIATDSNGYTKHLCKSCMCSGSQGAFEDTFFVSLPWWFFSASAEGYLDTDPTRLNVPEYQRRVRRGPPTATVTIPIQLRRRSN